MGDTNTASEPSLLSDAVPTNLIVLRKILAYSKSTAPTYIEERDKIELSGVDCTVLLQKCLVLY